MQREWPKCPDGFQRCRATLVVFWALREYLFRHTARPMPAAALGVPLSGTASITSSPYATLGSATDLEIERGRGEQADAAAAAGLSPPGRVVTNPRIRSGRQNCRQGSALGRLASVVMGMAVSGISGKRMFSQHLDPGREPLWAGPATGIARPPARSKPSVRINQELAARKRV